MRTRAMWPRSAFFWAAIASEGEFWTVAISGPLVGLRIGSGLRTRSRIVLFVCLDSDVRILLSFSAEYLVVRERVRIAPVLARSGDFNGGNHGKSHGADICAELDEAIVDVHIQRAQADVGHVVDQRGLDFEYLTGLLAEPRG